ncbi:unnamed protein product [Chrysoparadoxa australica]
MPFRLLLFLLFVGSLSQSFAMRAVGQGCRRFSSVNHRLVTVGEESQELGPVMFKERFDALVQLVKDAKRLVVLTGAGISTSSGIPDYRGPQGSYSQGHKPMTWDQFLDNHGNRQRYWSRSTFGYEKFREARPNDAHYALARMEAAGKVSASFKPDRHHRHSTGVITQNVDRLHSNAGSRNVIDLHGANSRVVCTECGSKRSRNAFQDHLGRINWRWLAEQRERQAVRADGDTELSGAKYEDFHVPHCERCNGVLKPDVVFFGDQVPRDRVDKCFAAVGEADMMLVAGTSLMVYSGYRFVERAAKEGKPVAGEDRYIRTAYSATKESFAKDAAPPSRFHTFYQLAATSQRAWHMT